MADLESMKSSASHSPTRPHDASGGGLSRRTVLRGLGTAIALPLLESMTPAARLFAAEASGTSAAAGATAPVRMAFCFVPNGVFLDEWTPERTGRDFELPKILQPLAPIREQVLVLSGLTHDKGRANGDGAGDHARSASVFLTGAQPIKTSGANIRVGVSVDQVAAGQIGRETRFPSLELAIESGRNSGNCDSGYSCAYSNNISWASEASPMAKEIDPRRVFERLFSNDSSSEHSASLAKRRARRRSILDFALGDAKRLEKQLGRGDRRKVDEYLSGVRAIEMRLQSAESRTRRGLITAPPGLPEEAGTRLAWADHVRLMTDMMVLAFQADVTRISTFMLARAGSNRSYREIEVSNGHHELSHHQGRRDNLEKISKINHFHIEQLAYFLDRLASIPEGDGTLLDHSMIFYGSGLSDGNRHNNENLPILLAGRGGGSIDSGRHIRYPEETPVCNLFLSMLDRAGVDVPRFGDSTGRLRHLSL